MSKPLQFGKEFDILPDSSHIEAIEITNMKTRLKHVIENIPGKKASVRIYAGISKNNTISPIEARKGLELYGDYVKEELVAPDSHPNIRLLLDAATENYQLFLTIK